MKQFNIYEAKAQLSKLVDLANKGESFVIAKAGTSVGQTGAARRARARDEVQI